MNGDGVVTDALVVVVMGDADEDGTLDSSLSTRDNCRETINRRQADADGDDLGDPSADESGCDPDPDTAPIGGLTCDLHPDGFVDRRDVELVFAARGLVAAGDPRDADGDGAVTVLDAAFCSDHCNNPDCEPPRPRACGLGGEVVLLWAAGAALHRAWRGRRGRRC